jgi:hypothetical protein
MHPYVLLIVVILIMLAVFNTRRISNAFAVPEPQLISSAFAVPETRPINVAVNYIIRAQ